MELKLSGHLILFVLFVGRMVHFSRGQFKTGDNYFVFVRCADAANAPPGVASYDCQVNEGDRIEITSGVYSYYDTPGVGGVKFDAYDEKTTVIDAYGGQYDANPAGIDDATTIADFAPMVVENGLTPHMISYVDIVDDCDVENDEIFTLYDSSFPYDYYVDWKTVVIKDNDDNYWIEQEHFDVMETVGTFYFNVMRDPIGQLLQHTLEFSTCDITATSMAPSMDFQAVTNGQIAFDLGSPSGMGSVDIVADLEIEVTEVFGLNIVFNDPSATGCTGKVIEPSKAYVTIHDSLTSTALFKIEQCDYTVTEPTTGTTQFMFKILREGNMASASTISYTLRDVSATSGQDYETPSSTTVTFNPMVPSEDVSVTINADNNDEQPETFEVIISTSQPQTNSQDKVVSPYKAIVTIQDVTTTKSCVSVSDTVVLESSPQVQLTLRREGNTNSAGSIAVVTEDVDAIAPDDYTPRTFNAVVTFEASEREKTITIDIKDDYIKENSECFKVKLLPPNQLFSQALDICTPEAQVQIKDDDDQFNFEGIYFKVFEDDGSVDIYVKRCGFIDKESSVRVASIAGTSATIGNDFFLPSSTVLNFAPNQQSQVVTIDIRSDAEYEGEEEFTLVLNPFSPDLEDQICVPRMATVVICDRWGCIPPCLNGGVCNAQRTCDCPFAYTGAQCQTRDSRVSVDAEYTITDAEFDSDLNNPNSPRYIALKAFAEQQLTQSFRGLPGFLRATVTGFLPGSVRVLYEVEFDPSAGSDQADVFRMSLDIANNEDFTRQTNQPLVNQQQSDQQNDDLTDSAIIGIVFGIVGLILILALIMICYCMLARQQPALITQRGQQPALTQRTIEQQPLEIRPFNGPNPQYIANDGILGIPTLY